MSYGAALPETYPMAVKAEAAPSFEQIPGGRTTPSSPYQPALFPARETPRVVPIRNTPAPRRTRPRSRAAEETSAAGAVAVYQQTFDWNAPVNRRQQAAREAVRYCDAPVGTPLHRAAAAAVDYSMVAIAVGLLVAMLYVAAPELVVVGAAPYFAALAGICGVSYKLLWAMVDTDSPGIRWTQLRTLNFDGMAPSRNERLMRVAAGCLSVLAGGLGLLWATADEETLSWHDHMSKTFLTPRFDSQFRES